MAFSYDPTLNDVKDKLRFNIQDTKEIGHLFEDEELIGLLNTYGNSLSRATVQTCMILAGLYAGQPDEKLGPYMISHKHMADKYLLLANQFERVSNKIAGGYAGGITVSDVLGHKLDNEIIKGAFERNLMNYYNRGEVGELL